MKARSIKFLFLFFGPGVFAQPNTEVYLMDINQSDNSLWISSFKNVSNNNGYDNQPSFDGNDRLYYAGTRNGQTDIVQYDITKHLKKWFNVLTSGSEYSPKLIPETYMVAAVRLDTSGLQRLYLYQNASGTSSLFVDLAVAYFNFYDNQTVLASVLSSGQLDLVLSDLRKNSHDTIALNVGRSIHKVPGKEAMSYAVVNDEKNYEIFEIDMDGKYEGHFVCELPIGVQDFTHINETQFLIGSGDKLYLYDLFGSGDWMEVADLSAYRIKDITRLAISPDGTKLALVAEPVSEIRK